MGVNKMIVMKIHELFSDRELMQSVERGKWIGKTVHSLTGTEYVITGFGFRPGVITPKSAGVWLQRTDGTYQMRFLTITQYNNLFELEFKPCYR